MIGETVSHYRILEKLGGGGMGVVYKALDLRLDRFVALKFLPPELTRDAEANERFMQEAKAASALDHPHICTIHEIDETPGGQVFLTMAYYDGETLKRRIEQGPLALEEALEIATQVARGLLRAHESGIVHRDIKPANLMVSRDGVTKILDFGLAKLTGQSGLTRTGVTVGTVMYMSPEQIRGQRVDRRTDLWALGVVLYEMLSGRRPFRGEDVATLHAILNDTPQPINELRDGLPSELQQVLSRALEKDVARRYGSAADLLKDLTACQAALTKRSGATDLRTALKFLRRPRVAIPAGVLLVIFGVLAGVAFSRSTRVRWAREQAAPEIRRLIAADDYIAAFAVAERAERYTPKDPVLANLWAQISAVGSITTTPEAADVYMQEYATAGNEWKYLGRTPVKDVRLPRAVFRFRVEKEGYETDTLAAKNPGVLLHNQAGFGATPVTLSLLRKGTAPEMVLIPGGTAPVSLTGFNLMEPVQLDPFLIDRHEVTNKQFKQFVQGEGYQKEQYWRGLSFTTNGRQLTRQEAMPEFSDSTGRPGPATWELGEYPSGQADYPVAGVSWYEAVAYCRFQAKTLPTIFHWARAAMSPLEVGSALAPAIVPLSNFNKKGPVPVGTTRGLGPYGTYDMAGNVREWTWNEAAEGRRWILGGAWNDPEYMFTIGYSLPPFDRSATNGFRCARSETGAAVPERLLARTDQRPRDYETAKAVSDEIFEVYKSQFSLVKSPLNQHVDGRDTSSQDWIREKISLDAGYDGERSIAYVFLPPNAQPPYQLAVYFPPLGGAFASRTPGERVQPPPQFDFVVRSGRALIWPIYKGSYERWDSFLSLTGDEYLRSFRARMFHWRQDLGRVLDVLSTRDDVDISRVAYLGFSFGSSAPLPLLALEDRIKIAVLVASGFTTYLPVPAEADAVNYVSRVTIPVLMLGGRHDYLYPLETSQMPMFDRLGTPSEHKRHVVFDGGHGQFPRSVTIREVLAWLDRYLGPVRVQEGRKD